MFCVYLEGLSSNEDKKKQGWQGTVCLRIEELGICQGAAGCSSLRVLCLQGKCQAVAIPFTGFTGFTTPPSPSRWLSAASSQPSAEAITSKSVYVDSCVGRLQIRNLALQMFSILMGKHGKYIRWFQSSDLGQAPLSDKPTLHDDILELNQTHEVVECQNQDFTNRNQWPGTQFCRYLLYILFKRSICWGIHGDMTKFYRLWYSRISGILPQPRVRQQGQDFNIRCWKLHMLHFSCFKYL